MKKHVEVEGGELAIRNKKGDVVIIPKGNKKWVEQKLKEKCYECIDKFVSKLPTAASKAQDGGTYPPGNEPTYIGSDLPEVTVTAKAPGWYKNVRQYAKDNPFNIDTYVQERMQNPRGRDKIKAIDPKRYEKELRQEGLKKRQEELQQQAASYIGSKKPKDMTRAEWLNTLSSREEQLVKTDPKYQTSLWQDTKRGLQSLGEVTPVQAAANISKDKGYSAREKQELIQGYMQQPGLSAISDVSKTLSPLAVPSKLVQSTYRKEYGPMEALAGKKNKASLFEDIVTDPLTYAGAGLLGKGSKVGKLSVRPAAPNLKNFLTTSNFNPKNLKTRSGLDWMKKWHSDPDFIRRFNVSGNPVYGDQTSYKHYLDGTEYQDIANKLLSDYKSKNYIDLLKDKGFKAYMDASINSSGVSYGIPDQIYHNRTATFPFNKKELESTRTHELSHLTDKNSWIFNNNMENMLLKPFGIDNTHKIPKPKFIDWLLNDDPQYFLKPSEIRARMNQARFELNLSPKDTFTEKMFDQIAKDKSWYGMGKYIKDKKAFIDLMNNFWAVPPVGISAATALQSKQNTKKPQ